MSVRHPFVEPAPSSTLHPAWVGTLVGALLLIGLSSAPLVQFGQRVFHESPVPGSASYSLGVVMPVVLAFALFGTCWRQLVETPPPTSFVIPVVLLATWTVASSFWSSTAGTSAFEGLLMAGVLAGGIWFGRALEPGQQLVAIALATHVMVVVSLVAGAMSPLGRGLGGWNGVFGSRNTLGPVALLALLTCLVLGVLAKSNARALAALALMAVVDVLAATLAGARTPLLALLAAVVAVGIGWVLIRRLDAVQSPLSMSAWPVGAAGLVSAGVVGLGLTTTWLDSMLSARPAVWRTVVDAASTAPVVGLGYRSLWVDKSYLDPLYIETGLVFDNAHNSVLELYVGTGVIGAACVVMLLTLALARPWRLLLTNRRTIDLMWIGVGAFVVLENLTEAFIVYHSMFWMLVVSAAVAPPRTPRRA